VKRPERRPTRPKTGKEQRETARNLARTKKRSKNGLPMAQRKCLQAVEKERREEGKG